MNITYTTDAIEDNKVQLQMSAEHNLEITFQALKSCQRTGSGGNSLSASYFYNTGNTIIKR